MPLEVFRSLFCQLSSKTVNIELSEKDSIIFLFMYDLQKILIFRQELGDFVHVPSVHQTLFLN